MLQFENKRILSYLPIDCSFEAQWPPK